MTDELRKKVDRAVALIRSAGADGSVVEVSYSGGKDSDVILELTRMAGIRYRVIYKNTTIDPPGTLKHVREQAAWGGVEIIRPQKTFFQWMAVHGFPNRFQRSCCRVLKEYKVLDRAIQGVRKCESTKRNARYQEPTECRVYGTGAKRQGVEVFYPILDWTDDDVVAFVKERGIKLHPLYYREDGSIDPTRRLGCMCCPLAYYKKRIEYFKRYPKMVKAYCHAAQKFMDTHPDSKTVRKYGDVYEWFTREVFFERQSYWEDHRAVTQFAPVDYREFLERYFGISF